MLPVWKELTDIVLNKDGNRSKGKPRVLRAALSDGRKITGASVHTDAEVPLYAPVRLVL